MKHLIAFTVTSLSASTAFAGMPVYVPPVITPMAAPAPDWTGPYIGVQAGVGNGEAVVEFPVTGDFEGDLSGSIYGLHAGYLYDLGNFVIGAEVDYNWADIQLSDDTVGNGLAEGRISSLSHVKARIGYDAGKALIYGTGGMAFMDVVDLAVAPDTSDSGYFVGAGVEFKFRENWTGGVEYLYHTFEEFGDGIGDPDITLQTIQARVSYHF